VKNESRDRARGAVFAGAVLISAMVFAAQVHTAAKNTAAGKAVCTLPGPDIADARIIAEKQVFNSFGCSGQNVSPALSWRNAPSGTKSFALLVYDPDAPTGSTALGPALVES
jgi:phosphatidylethanolamine-binding protein (PEBP) family uncharacterized protein